MHYNNIERLSFFFFLFSFLFFVTHLKMSFKTEMFVTILLRLGQMN